MPITLEVTRPKAQVTNTIPLNLEIGAVGENEQNDSFFIPINATGLTIPDYTIVDVTIANGSDILTTSGGSFSEVRVGDAIAGVSGLPDSTVIAVSDSDTIQIDNAATADGTQTLTFTPTGGGSDKTMTIIGIEINLVSNSQGRIVAQVTGHQYDGTLVDTLGTQNNSAQKINLNQMFLPLDSMLDAARIPRTN